MVLNFANLELDFTCTIITKLDKITVYQKPIILNGMYYIGAGGLGWLRIGKEKDRH